MSEDFDASLWTVSTRFGMSFSESFDASLWIMSDSSDAFANCKILSPFSLATESRLQINRPRRYKKSGAVNTPSYQSNRRDATGRPHPTMSHIFIGKSSPLLDECSDTPSEAQPRSAK